MTFMCVPLGDTLETRKAERSGVRSPGLSRPSYATPRHNSERVTRKWRTFNMVEGKGVEPSTSALRTPRSPN